MYIPFTRNNQLRTGADKGKSGALCSVVDYAFGEIHEQNEFFPINPENDPTAGVSLSTSKIAGEYADHILQALAAMKPENCKTTFQKLDDESYLNDGMPYPTNEPGA